MKNPPDRLTSLLGRGEIWMMGTALCFAVANLFDQTAMVKADPFIASSVKAFLVSSFALVVLISSRKRMGLANHRRSCWTRAARIYVAAGIVSEVIWTAIGSVLFLKERVQAKTFHDPCNLGQHMGIYESPRELIEAIPGVRLLEMSRNRDNSFCCGNGGFVRYDYEEMSVESELDRFAEAEATRADAVVSACPACQSGLLDAKSKAGSKMEVLDILELLAKAL